MFYSKAPQEFEILDNMPREKKNESGIIVVVVVVVVIMYNLAKEMKKVTRNKLLFLKNFQVQL